jgi:hypothetical protein
MYESMKITPESEQPLTLKLKLLILNWEIPN